MNFVDGVLKGVGFVVGATAGLPIRMLLSGIQSNPDQNKEIKELKLELEQQVNEINKRCEEQLLQQMTNSKIQLRLAERKYEDFQEEIKFSRELIQYYQKRADQMKQEHQREKKQQQAEIDKLIQNEKKQMEEFQKELKVQQRNFEEQYEQFKQQLDNLKISEDTDEIPQDIFQKLPERLKQDCLEIFQTCKKLIQKVKKEKEELVDQQGDQEVLESEYKAKLKVYKDSYDEMKQYQNKLRKLQQNEKDYQQLITQYEQKIAKQIKEIQDLKETIEALVTELAKYKQKCKDLEAEQRCYQVQFQQEKKKREQMLAQREIQYKQEMKETNQFYKRSQEQAEKQQVDEINIKKQLPQLQNQENERQFLIEKTLINQQKQLLEYEAQIKQFMQQIFQSESKIESLNSEKNIFQKQHEDLVKEFKDLLEVQLAMISNQQYLFSKLQHLGLQKQNLLEHQNKQITQKYHLQKKIGNLKLEAYQQLFLSYQKQQSIPNFNLHELDILSQRINVYILDQNHQQQLQNIIHRQKSTLKDAVFYYQKNANNNQYLEQEPFLQQLQKKIEVCQNYINELKELEKKLHLAIPDYDNSSMETNVEQKLYKTLTLNLKEKIQFFQNEITESKDLGSQLIRKFHEYHQSEYSQQNDFQIKKDHENQLNKDYKDNSQQMLDEYKTSYDLCKKKLQTIDQLSEQYYKFKLLEKSDQDKLLLLSINMRQQQKIIQEQLSGLQQRLNETQQDCTSEVDDKQQQILRIKQQGELIIQKNKLDNIYQEIMQSIHHNKEKLVSRVNKITQKLFNCQLNVQSQLKLWGDRILLLKDDLICKLDLKEFQELAKILQQFEGQLNGKFNFSINHGGFLQIYSVSEKLKKAFESLQEEKHYYKKLVNQLKEFEKKILETAEQQKYKENIVFQRFLENQKEGIDKFLQLLSELINFLNKNLICIKQFTQRFEENKKRLEKMENKEEVINQLIQQQQKEYLNKQKPIDEEIQQFSKNQIEKLNNQEKARYQLIYELTSEIKFLKQKIMDLENNRLKTLEFDFLRERIRSHGLLQLKTEIETYIEGFLKDFQFHLQDQIIKITQLQEQRNHGNNVLFNNNLEQIKQYINSSSRALEHFEKNIKNKKRKEFKFEAEYLSEKQQEIKNIEYLNFEITNQTSRLEKFYEMIDYLQQLHAKEENKQTIIAKSIQKREQTVIEMKFLENYQKQVTIQDELKKMSDDQENDSETDFMNYLMDIEMKNSVILNEGQ